MKTIKLTQKKTCLVSPRDYKHIIKYKWHFNGRYAVRTILDGKKKKTLYMHRFIMGNPYAKVIDHIDGNGLNNQRNNLRICSHKENFRNQKISKHNTSGAKGVVWNNKNENWNARITVDRKRIHLGCFLNKKDAIAAYNRSAKKYYGEYAKKNKEKEGAVKEESQDTTGDAQSDQGLFNQEQGS